ncbi:oligosaccharide translocation protein Rft1p [[Candida] anglica]
MSLLGKSTAGASFLVVGQIVTKLFTFLLNQSLIRYISPQVFGVSSYLEFLLTTALFFSREAVRLSIQRTESTTGDNENSESKKEKSGKDKLKYLDISSIDGTYQSIINFGYVAVLVGVPLSLSIFYWQLQTSHVLQETLLPLQHSTKTLALVALSVLLELTVEPLYVLNQFQLDFKKRTKFESIGVVSRCLLTFSVVMLSKGKSNDDGLAVFAFAVGQFAYSFMIFSLYHLDFYNRTQQHYSLLPQKLYSMNSKTLFYFNPKVWNIWKNIFVQMLFKQALTEGDKLLINYLCTVEEQGVYSVVTNYGSLVARLLFQPIEESLRLYLTRILATKGNRLEHVQIAQQVLSYLCIFYINLSLLIALAGYANATFLLRILLGGRASAKWSSTDLFTVFPQYVLYIPFLAFNGIFESFFNSVATKENIAKHSIFMSISTVVYLLASFIFIDYYKLGLSGLILANVANMFIRIIYCGKFIQSYFTNEIGIHAINLRRSLSKLYVPITLGLSIEFLQYHLLDKNLIVSTYKGFFISVTLCVMYLLGALLVERKLITDTIQQFTKKSKTK